VSEPVLVTDCDEVSLGEGTGLLLSGRGLTPYPAVPPPKPRPANGGSK
jgi:hypothetical protein